MKKKHEMTQTETASDQLTKTKLNSCVPISLTVMRLFNSLMDKIMGLKWKRYNGVDTAETQNDCFEVQHDVISQINQ